MEHSKKPVSELTIRFAGDSGDGMQLIGKKFSDVLASAGMDLVTFPDFPSEIRAPEGTLYGVSAFQVRLGSKEISTHGDEVDVLVAMNASSLKVNLDQLKKGGIIIATVNGFDSRNLKLAEYVASPLEDNSLKDYHVLSVSMNDTIRTALKELGYSPKALKKSKNFFALGILFWLVDHPLGQLERWIDQKFAKDPETVTINKRSLTLGNQYGAKQDVVASQFTLKGRSFVKGYYRNITGNHAVAIGLVAAAEQAKRPLFLGSYPITPATEILQYISSYKRYGIKHMQAEDEIAGITSAIGAAYGGSLAVTTTSGPGLSLKAEAMGLAVMLELPLIIVDVMRAGPSTGMPTKPEQSDLYQAMFGRHGEAPMPIVAASTPADCFEMTLEAARLAVKYMSPVLLLTDGYLAQSSAPWKIPGQEDLPELAIDADIPDKDNFQPYDRNPETLARPWVSPGMKGLEHRIGGLEKEAGSGKVSYDAKNHQRMTELRADKVKGIANDIPNATVTGPSSGPLLIVGWGSTHGAISTAQQRLAVEGLEVAHCHLRHLNPLPANLHEVFSNYDQILLPEMNMGQLQMLLQARYMREIIGYHKVQGQPFKAVEIVGKVKEILVSKEAVL